MFVVFGQHLSEYSQLDSTAVQNATLHTEAHRTADCRHCSTVQYSTVQCSTVQYSTVQYSTVQYDHVAQSTAQHSREQLNKIQQTGLHITEFHCTVFCHAVLFYDVPDAAVCDEGGSYRIQSPWIVNML